MAPRTHSEGSWRLEPVLGPTEISPALRNALGLGDSPQIAAHHIVGSDGGTLDPRLAHVVIEHAEVVCGACGRTFEAPKLNVTLHGYLDATSSANLECPHCHGTIRVTGSEDPSVTTQEGHWITTAQLTKPTDADGPGWPQLRTGDLAITQEEEPSAAPRTSAVISRLGRLRRWWPAFTVGGMLVVGVLLANAAADREQMNILIPAAALLVLAVAGTIAIALRSIMDRRLSILTILAVMAVAIGTLVPATGAVMRCSSHSPGADLAACDLTGADLSETDLTGADLSGANLTGANLTGAKLGDADLGSALLGGADLTRSQLDGANLRSAKLEGAILIEIGGSEADFRGADLSTADLTGADLTKADLGSTHLGSANLTGADLEGADLTGADVGEAIMEDASLSGATAERLVANGVDMQRARLTDADLTGASLIGANLGGADFTGARLGGANLRTAAANQAIFIAADLSGAGLSEVQAQGAEFGGANLTGTDLRDADLTGANLAGADLTEADLRGTELESADLTGATLRSNDFRGTKGLSNEMLAAALGVPEQAVASAVVQQDLRFESLPDITREVSGVPNGRGVGEAQAYRPSSDFHPIVVVRSADLKESVEKAPGVWTPPGLRFTELVATEKTSDRVVETCQYIVGDEGMHPLRRYQEVLHVSVFGAKSGKLVAEQDFFGSQPPACQFQEQFSSSDLLNGKSVYGGGVNIKKQVLPWLKQMVNPTSGT